MRRWCNLHETIVRKKRQNTLLHAVLPRNILGKTVIMCKSIYTSATIHLNCLPTTLQHTAAEVTWNDRDVLCIIAHDTTLAVWNFSMLWWPASSTPHSTEPRHKKNLIATWHWCQLDGNCDHQISTSIRVTCWWHHVFSCQRTVVDADGQIFSGKVSEPKTFGPIVKRNFYLPTFISRHPCQGWFHWKFIDNCSCRYLLHQKTTKSLGYRGALSAWSYVQPFWYDSDLWQTNRQISGNAITANIAQT